MNKRYVIKVLISGRDETYLYKNGRVYTMEDARDALEFMRVHTRLSAYISEVKP